MRDEAVIPAMSQYASGIQDVALWRRAKALSPLRLDDFPGFKRALEEGVPVVFTNPTEALPGFWIETFHIRSGLILPLLRDKRWVGVIHLNNSESTRAFDAEDVELARAIGVQLALVIDNARLVEETRSRLRDTETLLSVGRTINSTLDLMEVVRQLARAAANALGADSSGVYLTSDRGTLEPLAGYRVPTRFREWVADTTLKGPTTSRTILDSRTRCSVGSRSSRSSSRACRPRTSWSASWCARGGRRREGSPTRRSSSSAPSPPRPRSRS
ncbi:MAG: hypothetical protein DMD81_07865 [Candidatus Rokuibacteriota bacterium]|nr:MAG: hypothetical protein DMD81_07865 [Candidatus Rokubacteria bacterium]